MLTIRRLAVKGSMAAAIALTLGGAPSAFGQGVLDPVGDLLQPASPIDDPGVWQRVDAMVEAAEGQSAAELGSAGAVAEREASLTAHRGLSAGDAFDLLRREFGDGLRTLVWDASSHAREGRVREYLDDYTAVVQSESGRNVVMVSTLPLRREDAAGYVAPVRLDLVADSAGLRSVNAFVPVRFPSVLSEGIDVGEAGVRVHAEAAPGATPGAARPFGESGAFYGGIAADTDFLVHANIPGAEAFWQLRSPVAPEEHVLRFELPLGAALRQSGDEVEVVRAGAVLARVSPPAAVDAQGRTLPAEMILEGDRVRVILRHRERSDIAYPLLLDPVIAENWDWNPPLNGKPLVPSTPIGLEQWKFYTTNPDKFEGRFDCNVLAGGCRGWGLFVYAEPNWYNLGDSGRWEYYVPRYPDSTAFIGKDAHPRDDVPEGGVHYHSTYHGWHSDPNATVRFYAGIWSPSAGWWTDLTTRDSEFTELDVGNIPESPFDPNNGEVRQPMEQGKVAMIGLRMQYSKQRSKYSSSYAGGAIIYLDDPEPPQVTPYMTGYPSGWTAHAVTHVNAKGYDPGLGVKTIFMTEPPGAPPTPGDVTHPCLGTRLAPCDKFLEANYVLDTAVMQEGVNTYNLNAWDVRAPDQHDSGSAPRPIVFKVDRSAPTIAMSGELWDRRDETLEGNTFALQVTATDCTGSSGSQLRSGVKSIRIELDDEVSQSPTVPVESCQATRSATLDSAVHGHGPHTIKVTSVDHVGRETTEVWTVTTTSGAPPAPVPHASSACAAGDPPTWCAYASELDSWVTDVKSRVDAWRPGHLVGTIPSPQRDYQNPDLCQNGVASVRACFERVKGWQRALQSWLLANGALPNLATDLPDMPAFSDADNFVARSLQNAAVDGFRLVRAKLGHSPGRSTVTVSFHAPMSVSALSGVASRVGIVDASAFQGLYLGSDGPITAGYTDASIGLFDDQLDAFYGDQTASVAELFEGLQEDQLNDSSPEEVAGTQATIGDVGGYQTHLNARQPFVTAVTAEATVPDLADEAMLANGAIKSVHILQVDEFIAGDPTTATDAAMVGITDPNATVAGSGPAYYMPRNWNGRTKLAGTGTPLHKKDNYHGLKWTTQTSLSWYRGDDPHDRGFEVQGYPDEAGGIWSDGWGGPNRKGCLETTANDCKGGWNSNLPDAYRDDLFDDGPRKSFAVGTGNGRALRQNKAYFAYYLTNRGRTDDGYVLQQGQSTIRAKRFHIEQYGYCRAHGDKDSACFFANSTANVQPYPINRFFHRLFYTP